MMNPKTTFFLVLALICSTLPTVVLGQQVENEGDRLLIQGQVLDVNGDPVESATVEIWQTDANGIYDHPGDGQGNELDPGFQYYGTAIADENGNFEFVTIKPTLYSTNRPPHIHLKVKLDGVELLTSQWYFAEDANLPTFNQSAPDLVLVLVAPNEEITDDYDVLWVTTPTLVVITPESGNDGSLRPTTRQAEGPFYPVVNVSEFDNDLTVVGEPIPTEFTLLNLNTATTEALEAIPDIDTEMVLEFEAYRPYISIQQFRFEIGRFVDAETVTHYESFIYVPINFSEADAETLMQIPNVNEAIANALIDARPYADNDDFLAALGNYLLPNGVAYAANFLTQAE